MIGHPLKVRELLDEIARGEVLLPEIQRAYVWKGPQVTKLIDSLYRDYPAGQILLWDTIDLPITKNLAGVETPTLPSTGRPKIVLDGQQRLTSLYKALGKTDDKINVYFNLETEQFQLYLRRLDADPRWVPVREVVNGDRGELAILQRIAAAGGPSLSDPGSQAYLERLQRLRRIGEYKFPIEIFKSDDYEQVTELFVRINSAGTRLRAAELVLAQLALRLPGAIVEKFEKAMDDYADIDYELDPRFLIRALIAVATTQSRFRYLTEFWKKPADEIEQLWGRTRKGIDSAVNFVRQNGRFESSDWLPSQNTLIPLAAYFERHPAIAPNVESGLLRWFYVATLRGRYSTSPETALDEDLKAVGASDPIAELMKNVMPPGSSLQATADEFDDAGPRNPLFPLTYAAARKNGAKDWFTGVGLATDVVGADHEVQIHHVFPKALLKEVGVSRKDRDEIANLAFLAAKPNRKISSRPPQLYLAEIADKHPDRLTAQSIPSDRELWKLDRFQDFLAARRELLAAAVNDLIENPV
ncbi:MAG: GmrSD restriction endonuclease domain-containing protein [Thermoanaerobaculia bacterium]